MFEKYSLGVWDPLGLYKMWYNMYVGVLHSIAQSIGIQNRPYLTINTKVLKLYKKFCL